MFCKDSRNLRFEFGTGFTSGGCNDRTSNCTTKDAISFKDASSNDITCKNQQHPKVQLHPSVAKQVFWSHSEYKWSKYHFPVFTQIVKNTSPTRIPHQMSPPAVFVSCFARFLPSISMSQSQLKTSLSPQTKSMWNSLVVFLLFFISNSGNSWNSGKNSFQDLLGNLFKSLCPSPVESLQLVMLDFLVLEFSSSPSCDGIAHLCTHFLQPPASHSWNPHVCWCPMIRWFTDNVFMILMIMMITMIAQQFAWKTLTEKLELRPSVTISNNHNPDFDPKHLSSASPSRRPHHKSTFVAVTSTSASKDFLVISSGFSDDFQHFPCWCCASAIVAMLNANTLRPEKSRKEKNGKRKTPPTFHRLQCWAVQDVEGQKSHHGIKVLHAVISWCLERSWRCLSQDPKTWYLFETRRNYKLKNVETARQFQIFQCCLLKHSEWFFSRKFLMLMSLLRWTTQNQLNFFFHIFPHHVTVSCVVVLVLVVVLTVDVVAPGMVVWVKEVVVREVVVHGPSQFLEKERWHQNWSVKKIWKKNHQKSNTSDLQQKILYAFRNLENPQCKTSELESYHEDFDNQKSPRQKIAKAQVQQVQDSRPRGAQGVGSALKCRGDLPQWM